MSSKIWLLGAVLVALLAFPSHAPAVGPAGGVTTWSPIDVECPLCHARNRFATVMSWGSYVYSWPSKFQMVFWPRIDEHVVYTCARCRLSLLMWDFEEFPIARSADVRGALATVSLSKEYSAYTDIPMSERLAIAEKVYLVLARDRLFWCDFYRMLGYHLAVEKKPTEAAAARRKALAAADQLLADPENTGRRKELLVVRAAMHHFLGDDAAARADLERAAKVSEVDKARTDEQNKNASAYLDALIKEYLERLANNTVPNDDDGRIRQESPAG